MSKVHFPAMLLNGCDNVPAEETAEDANSKGDFTVIILRTSNSNSMYHFLHYSKKPACSTIRIPLD